MTAEFDYELALQSCASGKRQALNDLYYQEAPRLLAVVMRILQNRALAEDVVHDAFVKIWANASSFQPNLGSARGWIYTLTRNLALNALEKHQRQVQAEPDFLTDLLDQMHMQEDSSLCPSDEHSLQHCLKALDAQQQRCLLHAYIDGYTQEEISQLFEKPLGTIKSWIRRSLQTLKECLQ